MRAQLKSDEYAAEEDGAQLKSDEYAAEEDGAQLKSDEYAARGGWCAAQEG